MLPDCKTGLKFVVAAFHGCVKISAVQLTGDVFTSAWPSCTLQLSKYLLFDTEVIDTITALYKILLK